MNYLLLTVVRNEAKYLPNVITKMKSQTKLPKLWLIIDDNSKDGTDKIIKNIQEEWVIPKSTKKNAPKSLLNYSKLLYKNTELLKRIAKKRNISWGALATLDGDSLPEPEYFSTLLESLDKKQKIGIISGEIIESGNTNSISHRTDIPWGAAMVYRRECLDDIGGISPTPSHNSVEITIAQSKGWITTSNDSVKFEHLRPMGTNNGGYKGHSEMGRAAHLLGIPLSFALLKSMKLMFSYHPERGLGYLVGYVTWRGGKCKIPEVKAAYNKRWSEWRKYKNKR